MELNKKVEALLKKIKSEKFNEVISDGEKLLKKYPNNVYILNICGLAHQRVNNIEKSILYFNKAINIDPNNTDPKNNLANSFIKKNLYKDAEKLFDEILLSEPKNIAALVNYARLKNILLDFKKSIFFYEKVLKIIKSDLGIWMSLASVFESSGNFKKAKNIYKNILSKDLKFINAHRAISKINDYSKDPENLNQMLELYKDSNLNNKDKFELEFAISKAYHDKKEYDQSIKFFESANNNKKQSVNFDFKNGEKLFRSIKVFFENFDFKNVNKETDNNKKILFICGLPRSGTTLVEQILSAHNKVFGAGELDYLRQVINKFFIQDNKLVRENINKQILEKFNYVNEEYNKYINAINTPLKVISDKAPQNFIWIGFIKVFFPNAKIIHTKRNYKDTFLSIYKNNFASPDMNWSYDPLDIIKYFNFYSENMKFWKKFCGKYIYEVNYEEIIQNNKVEVKKLLNFCDLDWDENCLKHHESNTTSIKTVSIYQARQPIYKTSLNSFEYYSKYLNNYFEILDNIN
tara:strand:- start:2801 stop:4360 length:1560 start_codon:yes stop_codon:yes gene_type:complete